jgi:hypothetical protein
MLQCARAAERLQQLEYGTLLRGASERLLTMRQCREIFAEMHDAMRFPRWLWL